MSSILFGPAGNSESFSAMGYKSNVDIPLYLEKFGLNAFEYQCGRGVKISEASAQAFGEVMKNANIQVSMHAPYYISMSGLVEETRLNSVMYMLQSATALKAMGGKRIVFHAGSCGKQTRQQALSLALDTMKRIIEAFDENGFSDMIPCPEVMGKINQIGTVEEVLGLCKVDDRITPCIDFGHLNARTGGGLTRKEDFAKVLDEIAGTLQDKRAKSFHVHFSKIEYTVSGERRHLTFEDKEFGPNYEPFLELCSERNLNPTIICESAGTQAEDATKMKLYFESII